MDRVLSDRLEQVGAVEITETMFCLKTWTAVICARRCPYKRIPVQDGTPGWKKNGGERAVFEFPGCSDSPKTHPQTENGLAWQRDTAIFPGESVN